MRLIALNLKYRKLINYMVKLSIPKAKHNTEKRKNGNS